MNFSTFNPYDALQRTAWRRRFQALYQANHQFITYDPTNIKTVPRTLPATGVQIRVALCLNRPEPHDGENGHGEGLVFKNLLYHCTVRARPNTAQHMLVYCDTLRQEEFGLHQLELLLKLGAAYGSHYELFYNGVAPTWEKLHFQVIQRATTIWDANNLKAWPAHVEGFESVRLDDIASQVLRRLEEHRAKGHASDILVYFDGVREHVLLIPRQRGATRPPNELGAPTNFGTVGCLEMAGLWLANKHAEAFNVVAENPALYEQALRLLSI